MMNRSLILVPILAISSLTLALAAGTENKLEPGLATAEAKCLAVV